MRCAPTAWAAFLSVSDAAMDPACPRRTVATHAGASSRRWSRASRSDRRRRLTAGRDGSGLPVLDDPAAERRGGHVLAPPDRVHDAEVGAPDVAVQLHAQIAALEVLEEDVRVVRIAAEGRVRRGVVALRADRGADELRRDG